MSVASIAQQPAATPKPPNNPNANIVHQLDQPDKTVTYTSAADVAALIARAKTESKDDSQMVVGNILKLAPYSVLLEYRPAGKVKFPAGTHPKDAELFYVIDGSGTLVTGGTLTADHMGIDGGQLQKIGKGDFIFIPEGTPHWFTQVDKTLQLMSVHVPRPVSAQ
jgi:mannose-6-phosphate isomerase-like protein (cupin superfamily)